MFFNIIFFLPNILSSFHGSHFFMFLLYGYLSLFSVCMISNSTWKALATDKHLDKVIWQVLWRLWSPALRTLILPLSPSERPFQHPYICLDTDGVQWEPNPMKGYKSISTDRIYMTEFSEPRVIVLLKGIYDRTLRNCWVLWNRKDVPPHLVHSPPWLSFQNREMALCCLESTLPPLFAYCQWHRLICWIAKKFLRSSNSKATNSLPSPYGLWRQHTYLHWTSPTPWLKVGREKFKLFGGDGFFHLPQSPTPFFYNAIPCIHANWLSSGDRPEFCPLMLVWPPTTPNKNPSLPRTVNLTPRRAGVTLSLVSKLRRAGLVAVMCLATSPMERQHTKREAERRNRGGSLRVWFWVLHVVHASPSWVFLPWK